MKKFIFVILALAFVSTISFGKVIPKEKEVKKTVIETVKKPHFVNLFAEEGSRVALDNTGVVMEEDDQRPADVTCPAGTSPGLMTYDYYGYANNLHAIGWYYTQSCHNYQNGNNIYFEYVYCGGWATNY